MAWSVRVLVANTWANLSIKEFRESKMREREVVGGGVIMSLSKGIHIPDCEPTDVERGFVQMRWL